MCSHGRFRIRSKSRTLVFGKLDSGDSLAVYFFVCWGHGVVSFMSVAQSQRPKAKRERQASESYKSLFDSKPYLFQAV